MEETDYKIIYKLRAFYQEVLFQKIREYIVKVLAEKKDIDWEWNYRRDSE